MRKATGMAAVWEKECSQTDENDVIETGEQNSNVVNNIPMM